MLFDSLSIVKHSETSKPTRQKRSPLSLPVTSNPSPSLRVDNVSMRCFRNPPVDKKIAIHFRPLESGDVSGALLVRSSTMSTPQWRRRRRVAPPRL